MSIEQAEHIKTLKVAKYKTLNDTLFYTRYFFKKRFNRKFVIGDHHQIICAALDRVYRGECKRLIINLAPRYGKTEIAVKNFISKGLAINPAAKFIHLTYADDLALDNSEEIKDLVTSDEYTELFPHVQLKKDAKAKNKWYTTVGGGVYARAAGGQVTGFGAGSVDLEETQAEKEEQKEIAAWAAIIGNQAGFGGAIVIDDPIKPEDANSDVIRKRVNNRFDSTIRNRVNSRNTPIVVIGQRVHALDLSGYLMEVEPGEWEVISLPCLTFDENQQQKALWPFKHTVSELLKLKAINEHVFDTQYQQDAEQKTGLLFPKSDLHYFNPTKTIVPEFTFIPVDPADGGGDYYAAPKCDIIGDKVFINKVIFNKRDTDENIPDTKDMAVEGKAHAVQVESNGGWKLARKSLKLLIREILPDCVVRSINARTSKETRILAAAAWVRNHCYFREDWETSDDPQYRDFMKNLTGYMREGKNKNDDAPDVMAQLYEYCDKNLGHIMNKPQEK